MLNFSLVSVGMISAGLLLVLLFNTNPNSSSAFTIGAFFLSLLVFLSCLFSILGIAFKKLIAKNSTNIMILRRSLLAACLIAGLLFFSSIKVLNTMSAITYLVALVLLEFFISSKKIEREGL